MSVKSWLGSVAAIGVRRIRTLHRLALPRLRQGTLDSPWLRPDRRRGAVVLGVISGLVVLVIGPSLSGSDRKHNATTTAKGGEITGDAAIALTDGPGPSWSNPRPAGGTPHGRGITHVDYPNGYEYRDVPRPSFDNYLGNLPGLPADERSFLAVCVRVDADVCRRAPVGQPLAVTPGDQLDILVYLNNDADGSGNNGGAGPSVARNTRVGINYPTGISARQLSLDAYLYADNALVDQTQPQLHTISDRLTIKSLTGKPIELQYVLDSAQFLQARPAGGLSRSRGPRQFQYQVWSLTDGQQYWLFTGRETQVAAENQADPNLGLPIGSDGSNEGRAAVGTRQGDRLAFLGGIEYHGFLRFHVRVLNGGEGSRRSRAN